MFLMLTSSPRPTSVYMTCWSVCIDSHWLMRTWDKVRRWCWSVAYQLTGCLTASSGSVTESKSLRHPTMWYRRVWAASVGWLSVMRSRRILGRTLVLRRSRKSRSSRRWVLVLSVSGVMMNMSTQHVHVLLTSFETILLCTSTRLRNFLPFINVNMVNITISPSRKIVTIKITLDITVLVWTRSSLGRAHVPLTRCSDGWWWSGNFHLYLKEARSN